MINQCLCARGAGSKLRASRRLARRASNGTDLRLVLTGPNGQQIDVDLPRRGAPAIAVGDHFRLRPFWGAMFSDGAAPAAADPIRLSA